jgi:ribosomal protein S12 methylthiotransferase accessory factor
LVQLEEHADSYAPYGHALSLLYGTETLRTAQQLLNGESRFFGLGALGANMEGSNMHQKLLAAYRKIWKHPA